MSTRLKEALLERNQAEIAREFGISRQAVGHWAHDVVPVKRIFDVQRITGLPLHEIRPDLYPSPDERPIDDD